MIPYSQIFYNIVMFYITATFVKVAVQAAIGCSDLRVFVHCSGSSTLERNCETGLFMYITVSQQNIDATHFSRFYLFCYITYLTFAMILKQNIDIYFIYLTVIYFDQEA